MSVALLDIASWLAIGLGGLLCVIGAFGILRLPDTYTRMHAASLIDTGGVIFIVLGLALQAGFTLVTVKLVILVAFLMFTSPTTTHALARAMTLVGIKPRAKDGNSTNAPRNDGEAAAPEGKVS